MPPFPAGSGGLAGTVDDWYRFARMLLSEGVADGRRLLSADSLRQMTTDHLTTAQREANPLLLEDQGWGYAADVTR